MKRLPAIQETWVRFLGREDPLEKEMAIHSSTLAWKIPWMEDLIGYSPWGHKELDMTERLHYAILYLSIYNEKLQWGTNAYTNPETTILQ